MEVFEILIVFGYRHKAWSTVCYHGYGSWMSHCCGQGDDACFEIVRFFGSQDCGGYQRCEVIDDEKDVLSFSLYNICVKVPVRLRHVRFGFIYYHRLWLFLDDGASVAVVIQLVQ